jgi:hypothetical protein
MSRIDSSLDRSIMRLAQHQHGLIARHQLLGLGAHRLLARSRVRSGAWREMARGVHVVGAAPTTFHQRAMAAALTGGDRALVSHRTAARLYEIVPKRAVPLEISVPRPVQIRRAGVHVHRSRDLHLAEPSAFADIPVTGLARTIVDLGAVEPDLVRPAVWEARRVHGLAWEQLLGALVDHGRSGRSGVGALRPVVAEHYGEVGRDSTTEDHAYVEIFGGHHFHDEDLLHLDLHRRNQIELAGNGLLIYSGRLLSRQPDQS